ncbi:glycoside hydrolase family 16 protein [Nocardioides albidus]|uniref:Glycoside hydrolase family 16 protein n=1 Tax=Nocardioides albidus TaxID=1517589 RepID=A0A5C4VLF8_9ACTN|nr:glycoside hydrolase family 16 protein [Nocardioides albidus]TNM36673.1 glycoside hydrolase family 16 protein [Nocardioides albidus]
MKSWSAALVLLLSVVSWGLAAPAAEAASDDRAPVLHRPGQAGTSVVFTGRARPRAKVRLQVRSPSAWATVGRDRASRGGRFRIVVATADRRRTFRAVSAGRTSKTYDVASTPAVAVPASKPVGSDACGPLVTRPGGGTYQCTLVDDFDGSAVDRGLWHVMDKVSEGAACMVDTPQTVAVHSGALHLTVRPAASADQCPLRPDGTRAEFVTGSVNTFWKWSQQYGRFEARMRSQAVPFAGPQEAFWLWPDIRYSTDLTWPASGEIDIAETYAAHPNLAIPFLHYTGNDNGGPVPGLNTAWNCAAARGQWHTYALEWTADQLVISVDGRECLRNTTGGASFRKRFIMAFSQLLTPSGANQFLPGDLSPTTLDVDYVKVWR